MSLATGRAVKCHRCISKIFTLPHQYTLCQPCGNHPDTGRWRPPVCWCTAGWAGSRVRPAHTHQHLCLWVKWNRETHVRSCFDLTRPDLTNPLWLLEGKRWPLRSPSLPPRQLRVTHHVESYLLSHVDPDDFASGSSRFLCSENTAAVVVWNLPHSYTVYQPPRPQTHTNSHPHRLQQHAASSHNTCYDHLSLMICGRRH